MNTYERSSAQAYAVQTVSHAGRFYCPNWIRVCPLLLVCVTGKVFVSRINANYDDRVSIVCRGPDHLLQVEFAALQNQNKWIFFL